MDSPQREGTRAWHAHIGLEQSNVARVERADLLVFLVVFVVDDRTSSHVSLRQGVGSVVEARGSSAAEKAAARGASAACHPPALARSGRWALTCHRNKRIATTHSRVWSSRRASLKGKPQTVSPMATSPRGPLALDAG